MSMGQMVGTAHPARWRAVVLALVFAGVFLVCFGLLWDPAGRRQEGRILVDEYHSTWEPTDRPFDTEWYGEKSGYNYACIYDYCSRFYSMRRLAARIDDVAIQDCDVLVVKVPTSRYAPEEVDAIERFVRKGGGLLLIGEHTNVFNTGTHLNDIAGRFGFRFRYDCLFDIDTVFEQLWRPPPVRHPIVQNLPFFDFAVSCSISPRMSLGHAVIRSTGLRNLPADYHVSNFYPQVEDHAYSRYGAFIQLWATRRGAGRVAAFTDLTVFSNFSTFEPGKAELMLGMLEWLNHRNPPLDPRLWPMLAGLVFGLGGLIGSRRIADGGWRTADLGLKKIDSANPQAAVRNPPSCVLVLVLGMFAWATATVAVRAAHHVGMPLPKPAGPVESAYRVAGGEPVISLDGTPVPATVRHGQGSVTVVGFGSRFAAARMGVTGDVVPDAELRRVFDLEFTLLRDLISR